MLNRIFPISKPFIHNCSDRIKKKTTTTFLLKDLTASEKRTDVSKKTQVIFLKCTAVLLKSPVHFRQKVQSFFGKFIKQSCNYDNLFANCAVFFMDRPLELFKRIAKHSYFSHID